MYVRAFPLVVGVIFPFLAAASVAADPPAKATNDIVLGDCLVLKPVGRSGRAPLHLDALEAEIVAGKWAAPKAGDAVELPGVVKQTWEAAKANADGSINHAALGGGYLYWRVTLDSPKVLLLDAAGHSSVLVNGEPRTGDPYENGMVRLPVALKQGANDLLFHCGRGHLRAKLTAPPAAAFLDLRDTTLPDFRAGADEETEWAALLVVNASEKPLTGVSLRAATGDGEPLTTGPIPPLPPCSIRKVGFRLHTAAPANQDSVPVKVELIDDKTTLDTAKFTIRVRKPDQSYKRTFVSDIDGSVQYYAVQPARLSHPSPPPMAGGGEGGGTAAPPALVLTLHGASVEATGQADAYGGKDWCHIVAPTNRRPYGFDWEDWGRFDALEVLALAKQELHTDPLRTYLTGHSMGGHGVWQVGATVPDRWAAIAPSAGWISFSTYAGGARPAENPTPMQAMLQRAASPSDTASLAHNYTAFGVYVLHGDADDNVPVEQAREMRRLLGTFHPDFCYYERPGAGHWWGNACVDWPPLFEFLGRHTLTPMEKVRQVDFTTASPSVSSSMNWASIDAQTHPFQYSTVHLQCDADKRRFSGTTENVSRLALDLAPLKPGGPVQLELDAQKIENIAWPKTPRLWLEHEGGKWSVTGAPSPAVKNAARCGPFKDAFRNRVIFVYGTKGTAEENAWAFAKARFDAETFWYRGNASVDVVPDTAFDAEKDRDRNVILYGNADGNAAWKPLLGDGPVQATRGAVIVGDHREMGDDLACLFVRPRPGDGRAEVGVVAGSGLVGMRLTDHLSYFLSGAEYPDCLVFGPDVLTHGVEGVRAAGFFGQDWGVSSGEFAWAEK
jgi:pimeloyl-ACP methyl ester carboxylesterase